MRIAITPAKCKTFEIRGANLVFAAIANSLIMKTYREARFRVFGIKIAVYSTMGFVEVEIFC
ncbi:MAG: hypothetical protein IEMM0002_1484 [bacterium]|nr:MAG: hypothetical protein IEMM0002_1484 [bacterium]